MCTQERYLTNLHGGNILSLNMFFPTERELTNMRRMNVAQVKMMNLMMKK